MADLRKGSFRTFSSAQADEKVRYLYFKIVGFLQRFRCKKPIFKKL